MEMKPLTYLLCTTGTIDVIMVKNLCKDDVYSRWGQQHQGIMKMW